MLVKHADLVESKFTFAIEDFQQDQLDDVIIWLSEQGWTVVSADWRFDDKVDGSYKLHKPNWDVLLTTTYLSRLRVYVILDDPVKAMLFKLAWCGYQS
jgi:hypothetical protein